MTPLNPAMNLQAIFTINKMFKSLEAIAYYSSLKNPAKNMGAIYVIASNIVKEVEPEIAAIKASADKYESGDVVRGY